MKRVLVRANIWRLSASATARLDSACSTKSWKTPKPLEQWGRSIEEMVAEMVHQEYGTQKKGSRRGGRQNHSETTRVVAGTG